MIAFIAVWFLALAFAAGASDGSPSETAFFIATAIVVVPTIWLGRKLFRRKPSDKIIDPYDANAAVAGVAMAHTIPAVADDLMDNVADVDVDVDFD